MAGVNRFNDADDSVVVGGDNKVKFVFDQSDSNEEHSMDDDIDIKDEDDSFQIEIPPAR